MKNVRKVRFVRGATAVATVGIGLAIALPFTALTAGPGPTSVQVLSHTMGPHSVAPTLVPDPVHPGSSEGPATTTTTGVSSPAERASSPSSSTTTATVPTPSSPGSKELTTDPAAAPSHCTPVTAKQLGATVAPTVPVGTDMSKLTDAQLKLYHLPPRPPTNTPAYGTWLQAMKDSLHAVTPQFCLGRPHPGLLKISPVLVANPSHPGSTELPAPGVPQGG